MTRTLQLIALVVLLGGGAVGGYSCGKDREFRRGQQELVKVNDSTQAKFAQLKRERDTFKALADAAKEMGAKPIAGVEFVIQRDTVYIPAQDVPTSTQPDSSRTASLDSTTSEGYAVHVEAVAPPYPAPLKLGVRMVTPELRPQVGVVAREDGYYGVVSLGGRKFTTTHAFYTPPKERPIHLLIGGGIEVAPQFPVPVTTIEPNAYAALQIRLKKDFHVEARVGHDERPYAGLYGVKTLW